jgi:glycosyltransferase involved in cell wall biosynthesis
MPDASETKRRLRVLTLVDHFTPSGGAERLSARIAMRLDPERFEPIYCASRWNPARTNERQAALRDELEGAGVRVIGLGRTSRVAVWRWWPLYSLLRRERVDVVHSHKFGSNAWAVVIGTLARVPAVVAHEHSWSYQGRPLRRLLDRRLIAAGSDAFLAVSAEDRRRMIEVEHIDPEEVTLLPNGIDPLPPADGARVRAEAGIPANAPAIGTVAVLREEKQLHLLIEAVADLVGEHPELRLLIAGAGPQHDALQALAERLGVARNVLLLGPRGDVPDILAAVDVAVVCSRFEGSPLSVLEYMDAGLPVVASRVGGLPDLVEDRVNGLLAEPGDPHSLAAAIGELLADPELRRTLGERGRERRRAEFDFERMLRRLEGMYEELAGAAEGEGA